MFNQKALTPRWPPERECTNPPLDSPPAPDKKVSLKARRYSVWRQFPGPSRSADGARPGRGLRVSGLCSREGSQPAFPA